MRSQEKQLIKAKITRPDGFVKTGPILPKEKINLEEKGFKIDVLKDTEFEKKVKEEKRANKTKELKSDITTKS